MWKLSKIAFQIPQFSIYLNILIKLINNFIIISVIK